MFMFVQNLFYKSLFGDCPSCESCKICNMDVRSLTGFPSTKIFAMTDCKDFFISNSGVTDTSVPPNYKYC